MKLQRKEARKIFWKEGACSSAVFNILNREFDQPRDQEVRAARPLAGGIMQRGYQCGMLWGSSLAVGAECYRRYGDDLDKAIAVAVSTTQSVMESFKNTTQSHDCLDITECDWTNKLSVTKYMLTGKFLSCLKLIEKWAPQAIETVEKGLAEIPSSNGSPISCATEVAKRMGASAEQTVMVAGLAGGMGLSGNGCGALAAALWMNSMDLYGGKVKKSTMFTPVAQETLEAFLKETDFIMRCDEITGEKFENLDHHTTFIRNGGCQKLMEVLVQKRNDRKS